jgi:hypothetical protein
MAIDEQARHELFKRLEDVLGGREASTLMAHLPPVGWADVATKGDLEALRLATKGDVETLEARTEANLHLMEARLLRTIVVANSASILTVGGLAFAAARLV